MAILHLGEVVWAMVVSPNYTYITPLDYIVRMLIDLKRRMDAKFQANPPSRSSGNRRNSPLQPFLFLRLTSERPQGIG